MSYRTYIHTHAVDGAFLFFRDFMDPTAVVPKWPVLVGKVLPWLLDDIGFDSDVMGSDLI